MCLLATSAAAQDPTGTIEGRVTDNTAAALPGAVVVATQLDTGIVKESVSGEDGFFRVPLLPVGRYRVPVSAPQFAPAVREPVQVSVSETIRLQVQLELASVVETVTVEGGASLVDASSNVLGRVVTGRELVDLPLNGRNFTQLGLLQTGVAPLTAGIATAGGTLRQGQAYAVNGMRPEQNAYLVDGGLNANRMDGGYALRLPVDAIAEFRILSQSAPPEYGGTAGATTSVVTQVGRQPVPRQPLRVPPQRRLRCPQLLLARGRAAQPAPVRRHRWWPGPSQSACSSSATTRASATSRA